MKQTFQILQKLGNFNVWRHITNFWSFVLFAAIIYDFFHENVLAENEVLLAISGIFAAALAIYSAEKEFRRWHHMHASIHPGEAYVILWTALIIFLVVYGLVFNIHYHMPVEVGASYIAVITILAITRESKNFYKRKKNPLNGSRG